MGESRVKDRFFRTRGRVLGHATREDLERILVALRHGVKSAKSSPDWLMYDLPYGTKIFVGNSCSFLPGTLNSQVSLYFPNMGNLRIKLVSDDSGSIIPTIFDPQNHQMKLHSDTRESGWFAGDYHIKILKGKLCITRTSEDQIDQPNGHSINLQSNELESARPVHFCSSIYGLPLDVVVRIQKNKDTIIVESKNDKGNWVKAKETSAGMFQSNDGRHVFLISNSGTVDSELILHASLKRTVLDLGRGKFSANELQSTPVDLGNGFVLSFQVATGNFSIYSIEGILISSGIAPGKSTLVKYLISGVKKENHFLFSSSIIGSDICIGAGSIWNLDRAFSSLSLFCIGMDDQGYPEFSVRYRNSILPVISAAMPDHLLRVVRLDIGCAPIQLTIGPFNSDKGETVLSLGLSIDSFGMPSVSSIQSQVTLKKIPFSELLPWFGLCGYQLVPKGDAIFQVMTGGSESAQKLLAILTHSNPVYSFSLPAANRSRQAYSFSLASSYLELIAHNVPEGFIPSPMPEYVPVPSQILGLLPESLPVEFVGSIFNPTTGIPSNHFVFSYEGHKRDIYLPITLKGRDLSSKLSTQTALLKIEIESQLPKTPQRVFGKTFLDEISSMQLVVSQNQDGSVMLSPPDTDGFQYVEFILGDTSFLYKSPKNAADVDLIKSRLKIDAAKSLSYIIAKDLIIRPRGRNAITGTLAQMKLARTIAADRYFVDAVTDNDLQVAIQIAFDYDSGIRTRFSATLSAAEARVDCEFQRIRPSNDLALALWSAAHTQGARSWFITTDKSTGEAILSDKSFKQLLSLLEETEKVEKIIDELKIDHLASKKLLINFVAAVRLEANNIFDLVLTPEIEVSQRLTALSKNLEFLIVWISGAYVSDPFETSQVLLERRVAGFNQAVAAGNAFTYAQVARSAPSISSENIGFVEFWGEKNATLEFYIKKSIDSYDSKTISGARKILENIISDDAIITDDMFRGTIYGRENLIGMIRKGRYSKAASILNKHFLKSRGLVLLYLDNPALAETAGIGLYQLTHRGKLAGLESYEIAFVRYAFGTDVLRFAGGHYDPSNHEIILKPEPNMQHNLVGMMHELQHFLDQLAGLSARIYVESDELDGVSKDDRIDYRNERIEALAIARETIGYLETGQSLSVVRARLALSHGRTWAAGYCRVLEAFDSGWLQWDAIKGANNVKKEAYVAARMEDLIDDLYKRSELLRGPSILTI